MTGIVIIDKPAGWTSHDVVAKLRRALGEKRIGHGGTLDPMATGVLPLFVGRATRAVEFMESADKEYLAGMRLGISTDTQDTTGEIVLTRAVTVGEAETAEAVRALIGEHKQLPPMYSAVKVGGKKLYDYARAGKEVERKARDIVISEAEPLGFFDGEYRFRVVCSKGTYVRTLCHELGEALGCGAAMSSLRRIRAGEFKIDEALSLESVLECGSTVLKPLDMLFRAYPSLSVDMETERRIKNGQDFISTADDGKYRVYSADGAFLAFAAAEDGRATVIKSFYEID